MFLPSELTQQKQKVTVLNSEKLSTISMNVMKN